MKFSQIPDTVLKSLFLGIVLFASSISVSAEIPANADDYFFNGELAEAKQIAQSEGKLLMVDFYASWCLPCKWMDQTTFNDRRVSQLLQQNYVAVKVDIDKKDGFNLKNKFDVQFLPTILIFSSEGDLLERLEETMPPAKMLKVLESHNADINKRIVTNPTNVSPGFKKLDAQPTETEEPMTKFDLDAYRTFNSNRTYRIQIGVFDDHKNAFDRVNEIRETFAEPIIVLNDYQDGNVLYKVMMGEFPTQNEAESFRVILKNQFGIDSIVQ